jgi:hypothetical protein
MSQNDRNADIRLREGHRNRTMHNMANARYLQPHKADLGPERTGEESELRWLQFDSSCI